MKAMNTINLVTGKKWVGYWKILNRLYSTFCRSKMDYGC